MVKQLYKSKRWDVALVLSSVYEDNKYAREYVGQNRLNIVFPSVLALDKQFFLAVRQL